MLFFKKHYLTRADLIHNVVISDKDISKSNLNREKQRLKEIKRDIFNMTREMERSARNIAHEVESLILVENVNLAEERMENNIKKAIFDATFFHKNIESFQKEFDLIKPVALEDEIKKWNKVYSRLQHDYRNIKRNLGLKIKDLKKEKIYYNQAIELEDIIAKYTHDLHDDFNKFQEYLKDLINTIDIQEDDNDFIEELLAKLEPIELKLETYDTKINKVSQSIKAEKGETKKIRKKAIDKWITESGEFRNLISYYRDGFTQFAETKEQIEKETSQFINEIETIGKKIHDKIKHKEFQEAYKLTESFRDVYNKIEKVSDTLNENLQKNYKKKRKLYPLFRSIEQEWLMHQNVLEKLTEKFRTEFRSSIDMGLEVHLKEHFISVVNGNITDLRAQFVKIEKELNSFFSKKNYPSKETVYNKLHKLQDHLKTRNEKVIRALDKGKKQSDDFELKIEKTMEKWVNFKNSFSNNINKLQDKLQEELIISAILQKAEIEKKNIFPIKKISRELSKDMDELAQELKKLKAQNRINIKIKDKTDELEIHNEVWRKSQALSQFSRVRIRELNNRCVTINNYLLNSLQHTQFLNDIFQTKDLAEEFKEKINNIKQKWKLKLDDYEVDDSYQLIEEIETKLFEKIKVYEEKSHEILKVCNLVGDFKNYTDQKLVELEDIVNGKIHYLYEEIQDIKIKKYKKNISWFNKEKQKLLNAIKKIEKDVQNKKSSLISKESKIIPAMVSLEEQFSEKKDVLIGNFENAEKDILDKISTLKIDKMKTELEELIQKSQDKLNLNLKKAEDEIRQKIKIQDFISAGKKMGDDFSEDLEDDLKDFDKEIKKLNKGFTKESSIFNIKYSYLIQNWEKFLLEYLNRIQEKDVELQKHMIKEYINMVIDALNEPYMPVDNIARDLKLKENLVKQRLMGLIKQGALSGKIDQKYNIYMKKGITVDKQIVDSLDAMRSKNVRAYLIMRRFGGALRYITPVISLILGIGSYVASQPNTSSAAIIAPIGIAMIILIPIVLYYIYWLYLGRKKALKGNVIVKGGEETQKQENLTVTTQSPPDNVVPGMGYMDEDEDTEKGPDELLEEELTAKTTITDFNADEDDHEGNPTFKKPYEY